MCNRFRIDASIEEISEHFAASVPELFSYRADITPKSMTPGVMVDPDGQRVVVPMQFAFSPHWCKTRFDPKKHYNNAMIESRGKPIWAKAFRERRCIVPLTAFQEPSYWNDYAGKEVLFTPTSTRILGVASLYRLWRGDGEEVVTMTLLMRPAADEIMQSGHERQPLFIEPNGYEPWLGAGEQDPGESHAILKEFALEPEYQVGVVRQMKDGWQKRQQDRIERQQRQLADMRW